MFENKRTKYLKNLLRQKFQEKNPSQGYLFSGPKEMGKGDFARELAKILECKQALGFCDQCPDCKNINLAQHLYVREISPETKTKTQRKTISLQKIFDLQKFLNLSIPPEYFRLVLIHQSEFLTLEAQNAFLKILEEPHSRSVLILDSTNLQNVLLTIQSRLQKIQFTPLPSAKKIVEIPENKQQKMAMLLGGGKTKSIQKFLDEKDFPEIQDLFCKIQEIIQSKTLEKKFNLAKTLALNENKTKILLSSLKHLYHFVLKKQIFQSKETLNDFIPKFSEDNLEVLAFKLRIINSAQTYLAKGYSPKLVLENLFLNL